MARRSITVYPARGPCVVPPRAPPRRGRLAVGRNLCRGGCGGRTMVQPGVRRPGRDRGRVLVGRQW